MPKIVRFDLRVVQKVLNEEIHKICRVLLYFLALIKLIDNFKALVKTWIVFIALHQLIEYNRQLLVKSWFLNILGDDWVQGVSKLVGNTSVYQSLKLVPGLYLHEHYVVCHIYDLKKLHLLVILMVCFHLELDIRVLAGCFDIRLIFDLLDFFKLEHNLLQLSVVHFQYLVHREFLLKAQIIEFWLLLAFEHLWLGDVRFGNFLFLDFLEYLEDLSFHQLWLYYVSPILILKVSIILAHVEKLS